MKAYTKIAAVLLLVAIALLFVPALSDQSVAIAGIALALALITTAGIFTAKPAAAPAEIKPAEVEAVKPAAPKAAPAKADDHSEVITLLGIMQEKGRLIDFLMDDITAYQDGQVGAAARIVHQGCKAALHEHFEIVPVSETVEGQAITVPAGYAADEFRLVGKLSGEAPFNGKLVHKGWKTNKVKLPRALNADSDKLAAITPAEVEIN
ncbi:DUF2760 domain-containing protein [Persicirhabdus sediminis]|uniref:DUF2760 domain-containing protein n=1 Tax=Persicirhabdus sediminis TaxID=454144 RepID=A0A8J7SQ94_9BACT|nr:DUF2760 domain-containing protein [Persicirhabdus sediminis]MBK1792858.1 DUF2760 domain-containing protein [Persicirhabdus sediminis]